MRIKFIKSYIYKKFISKYIEIENNLSIYQSNINCILSIIFNPDNYNANIKNFLSKYLE